MPPGMPLFGGANHRFGGARRSLAQASKSFSHQPTQCGVSATDLGNSPSRTRLRIVDSLRPVDATMSLRRRNRPRALGTPRRLLPAIVRSRVGAAFVAGIKGHLSRGWDEMGACSSTRGATWSLRSTKSASARAPVGRSLKSKLPRMIDHFRGADLEGVGRKHQI